MTPRKDPTYSDPDAVIGETDHDQHRADRGEGIRAPLTTDGADHAEMSVFDGAGNESVVVVTDDDEGRASEGTGASSEEAMSDAKDPGGRLGQGFNKMPKRPLK
jgi:hypothetical protein